MGIDIMRTKGVGQMIKIDSNIAEKLMNFESNQNAPEFMKNGEWFDIILNGYNGER